MNKPKWLVKLARKLDWGEWEPVYAEVLDMLAEANTDRVRKQEGLDYMAERWQVARDQRDEARRQRDLELKRAQALQAEVDRLKFTIANAGPIVSGLVLDQSGHPYREVTVEIIREVPEFITRLRAEIRLSHRVIVMLGSTAWEDGINQLGEAVKRLLTEKHNELVEHHRQATHLGPPGQPS